MDRLAFTKPNGRLVKNKDGHLAFLPNHLPPQIKYDESLIALVSEAKFQLGRLSGIGTLLPNPHLLIRPYTLREAVLSSKIEGTQASIMDVLRYQAGVSEEKEEKEQKRINEVVNYIRALDECLEMVKDGKQIDLNLIRHAHQILLADVRGNQLEPGKFRAVQNWIGPENTKIEDARYVPPPVEFAQDLLADLEQFIQKPPGVIPVLVQCAIVHYQFEAIHPFGDGNGRIGRLIIPLLLAQRKLLNQPLLYLSAYIEQHKTQYYNLLQAVSQKSAWEEWTKFFLRAVITQSRDAADNVQKLMMLKEKYDEKLRSKKVPSSVIMLTDYLFSSPLVTIPTAARYLNLTYPGTKKAIDALVDMGILKEQPSKARNKLFSAPQILTILS